MTPIPTPAVLEADELVCDDCLHQIAADEPAATCDDCANVCHARCLQVSRHTSGEQHLCRRCWQDDVPDCAVCGIVPDGDATLTTCHGCTTWVCGDCMVATEEYDYCPDCAELEGIDATASQPA